MEYYNTATIEHPTFLPYKPPPAVKRPPRPKAVIDENLFFAKYNLDSLAREKLHELGEEKQQEAMRKFNPVKTIQPADFPKVGRCF